MAGNQGSKEKVLYIMDILREETDEQHAVSAGDIVEKLKKKDLAAERKAVYKDIDIIIRYGWDVIKNPPPSKSYYLGERDFQLAEARLLVDAVESARFISDRKTKILTEKIMKCFSVHQREMLKSQQVYIDNRNKSGNEKIYYEIDELLKAINAGKKVKLHYLKRRIEPGERPKNEDRIYTVSPYALIWVDDHYYLVCNNAKYDNLMHLRVDKISKVKHIEEEVRPLCEVSDYDEVFDAADYVSTKFNMFSGEPEPVKIKCNNEMWQIIADRFGEKVLICDRTDDTFTITANAVVNGLDAWLMQWGDSMEVLEPESLRNEMRKKAKAMVKLYGKD